MDRSLLEYHLSTLTSRNQEAQFASFARKLAERTICPNLLPQTGPTGGGDSKVDSETYPVSELLSIAWYEGFATEAGAERWAFAFSAKKDWRSKVKSDIKKIACAGRNYRRGIFVTNQYVADRARAEVEDALRKEYGNLDVRILDLTWILDRIFSESLQTVAISELGLEISTRTEVQKGPIDVQREKDLDEIEARIKIASSENRLGLAFANDCIEAAILSRGLGHPRTTVEGRFQRALRVSEKHGTPHQRLVSIYQWAWTVFWWFEDYSSFVELYAKAEEYAKNTANVYDLELLSNLWYLLNISDGPNAIESTEFNRHTCILSSELERLAQEENRPSSVLQARSLRLLMKLVTVLPQVDEILRDLRQIVLDSEGLIGYPLEPLVELLLELGAHLTELDSYQELFDTILEVSARRKGEVTSARTLLRRGAQQIDSNRPYDAIVTLGLALRFLFKHETERDFVRALYLCSKAYEQVGLLWAARGALLNAASVSMGDFWIHSKVTQLQVRCSTQMKWLELKLGRIPHILSWHEVDSGVRLAFTETGFDLSADQDIEAQFDALLGILILKSDIWTLSRISFLPEALGTLGLIFSQVALRFALGDEEQLWKELTEEAELEDDDILSFFERCRHQPAADDLPDGPILFDEAKVSFRSNLLGCQILIESQNESPCVELAESVIAALESLMATGFREGIFPREPILTGSVRKSDFLETLFSFDLVDRQGRPHLEIRCSYFPPHEMSVDAQKKIRHKLRDTLIAVLARVFVLKSPEDTLTKLLRDDRALERAINFTSGFVVQGNVLGRSPKTKLSKWKTGNERLYPLRRTKEWDSRSRQTESGATNESSSRIVEMGQGDPTDAVLDFSAVRHTEIEAISLIRESLWERAGWSGTAYITVPDDSSPPVLAPIFADPEAAREIFREWRLELGSQDESEKLRISIIRGIDRTNPFKYRVSIGANMTAAFTRSTTRFATINFRLHTMQPSSNENLDRFLESVRKSGLYLLAHAVEDDNSYSIKPIFDDAIVKRQLHVRQAWEVGRHDPDSVGVLTDDDPIIPIDQQNAPVLSLIEWRRIAQ